MGITEYLLQEGIRPISHPNPYSLTREQQQVAQLKDMAEYQTGFFDTGLDKILAGLEHEQISEIFPLVKELIQDGGYDAVFEPCCQSGLLGVYLAYEYAGSYLGVDLNLSAIGLAKDRAKRYGLDPEMFIQADIKKTGTYTPFSSGSARRVLVGRNIVCNDEEGVDEGWIQTISAFGHDILLIERCPTEFKDIYHEECLDLLKGRGYCAEIKKEIDKEGTENNLFLIYARKDIQK